MRSRKKRRIPGNHTPLRECVNRLLGLRGWETITQSIFSVKSLFVKEKKQARGVNVKDSGVVVKEVWRDLWSVGRFSWKSPEKRVVEPRVKGQAQSGRV